MDRPTSAQIVLHSSKGNSAPDLAFGLCVSAGKLWNQNKYFYNPVVSCWTMVDRLTAVHRGAIISNRQGCSLQLSIKTNKQKDSDFYATDIFIVTQNIFWANPPPGAPVGNLTWSRLYENTLRRWPEAWHCYAVPEDSLLGMAGRKGEVQGCAILDAAIVFERGPNFNWTNLRNSQPWPSETSRSVLHRWWTHPSQDIAVLVSF